MKITVITVVKNAAETIEQTIRSIQSQDHLELEHIVVDGGSTDGTVELLWDPTLAPTTLITERDGGVYEGFNRGLAAATGDVIGFLNGDDVFDGPDVLSAVAMAFESGVTHAVYGDLVYVKRGDLTRVIRHWRAGEADATDIRRGWMPPHPTFYARREVLNAVGKFDASFRISGDYEYFLRVAKLPRLHMKYLPRTLVRMRAFGMSNWPPTNHLRKWREDLRAMRRHKVGGILTLLGKNFRKLPQLFVHHGDESNVPIMAANLPQVTVGEGVTPP